MHLTRALDISGPAGRLEAILMLPVPPPVAAAVVCHAHPLHGGNMHLKVVLRAARALQQNGVAALRFNFRGVGRSAGRHDEGRGEQDDVRAALGEIEARFSGLPLVLGGFSFGSVIALRVGACHSSVRALFALGFPAELIRDTSFLTECGKPRLFVQCENDVFGSGDAIRRLVEKVPEPREAVVLPGGDHLFTERLEELEQALSEWAARRPWERTERSPGHPNP